MKIHSDTLSPAAIHMACAAAGMHGVWAERLTMHGSRSRRHSFDVSLRGNSTRRPNPGTGGRDFADDEYAATWDEWGMFIEAIYVADPNALVGQYGPRHVFDEATATRFDTLIAEDACPLHKWVSAGPMIQRCSKCEATNNYGAIYAKGSAATSFA